MSLISDDQSCSQAKRLRTDLLNGYTETHSYDNNPEVLTLNDDCLLNICKRLSITDQINFALTCKRFFDITTIVIKSQHLPENTGILGCWAPELIKNYFRVVGSHIKHLNVNFLTKNSVLNDLIPRCRNVLKLKVSISHVDTNLMILLIDNMRNLEELEIVSSQIHNFLFRFLEKFKRLKSLTIRSTIEITGKNIELLKGLEKLTISECFEITQRNFRNICTNLNNLRHLDILHAHFADPVNCEIIAKYLPCLETLKLCCWPGDMSDINCLTKLAKLKKFAIRLSSDDNTNQFNNFLLLIANQLEALELHTVKPVSNKIYALEKCVNLKVLTVNRWLLNDDFLFSASKLTKLEELTLASCLRVTDTSILEILKNCHKLKYLYLGTCNLLTANIVKNALKILIKQHTEQQRKDQILITGTYMYCPDLLPSLHLVDDFSHLIKIDLVHDNCRDLCDYSEIYNPYDILWDADDPKNVCQRITNMAPFLKKVGGLNSAETPYTNYASEKYSFPTDIGTTLYIRNRGLPYPTLD